MIKIESEAVKSRSGLVGGNRKRQTFKNCEKCGDLFGPVQRLAMRFCSKECKHAAMATGHKVKWVVTKEALRAQRMVRYRVAKGVIIKPECCEFCGCETRLEGAHHDYSKPLEVKWLCIPCHRRYDHKEKKGGAAPLIIERWEKFSGKTAKLISTEKEI